MQTHCALDGWLPFKIQARYVFDVRCYRRRRRHTHSHHHHRRIAVVVVVVVG